MDELTSVIQRSLKKAAFSNLFDFTVGMKLNDKKHQKNNFSEV